VAQQIEEPSEKLLYENQRARGELFYVFVSVGKPAAVQARHPPSIEMQFV
jgi:hypothetical protein